MKDGNVKFALCFREAVVLQSVQHIAIKVERIHEVAYRDIGAVPVSFTHVRKDAELKVSWLYRFIISTLI